MKLPYKIAGGFITIAAIGLLALAIMISHNSTCPPAGLPFDHAESMKAIVYRCYGSPDILELTSIAKPAPADNEVLVKV